MRLSECRARVPESAPGPFRIAGDRPRRLRRRPGGPPRPVARRVIGAAAWPAPRRCRRRTPSARTDWRRPGVPCRPPPRPGRSRHTTSRRCRELRRPPLEIVTRRASASSSGETMTSSLVVIVAVAPDDLDAIFEERRLVTDRVRLHSAGSPPTTRCRCRHREGRCTSPSHRTSGPLASGSPRDRPSGCIPIPPRSSSRSTGRWRAAACGRWADEATGSGAASAGRVRGHGRPPARPRVADGRLPHRAAFVPAGGARSPGRSASA